MLGVKVRFQFKGRGIERTIAALSQRQFLPTLGKIGADLLQSVKGNIDTNGQGKWPAYSDLYAARKAAGKTPGGARFGMTMLKDSGQLYGSLRTVADVGPKGPRAYVFAVGTHSSGISNQELLQIHFQGGPRMPRRSAIMPSDLVAFTRRAEAAISSYLNRAKR